MSTLVTLRRAPAAECPDQLRNAVTLCEVCGQAVTVYYKSVRPGVTDYNRNDVEHRGGDVVFVDGFWAAPGVQFMPPPPGLNIPYAIVSFIALRRPRCSGPEGVFVPAPPGSVAGLIVPAPPGTAPIVVAAAPPIIGQGMHVRIDNSVHQVVNNITVNHVIVNAPATATATRRPFSMSVAMPAMARAAGVASAVRPALAAAVPARSNPPPPVGMVNRGNAGEMQQQPSPPHARPYAPQPPPPLHPLHHAQQPPHSVGIATRPPTAPASIPAKPVADRHAAGKPKQPGAEHVDHH